VSRVTFGMIVLNGEPFLRYNLRSLYPFAHQIIVVEGAAPAAAAIAGPDGHSTDSTLAELARFKAEEDSDGKVVVVTAEDEGHANGFWPGEKHEQSQAYARRATGDLLWQVDVDEFYRAEDMQRMIRRMGDDPGIKQASFKQITFWGGFDYTCDGWFLRRGAAVYHRLFRWGPGYRYTTHRPPTVVDSEGRDLRLRGWLDGDATARLGIPLYHYSLVFPKQVAEKIAYYGAAKWNRQDRTAEWVENSYSKLLRPFRVHNVYRYPSWLERFRGAHPKQIEQLRSDISDGVVSVRTRDCADVERLLRSRSYAACRLAIKLLDPIDRALRPMSDRVLARLGRGLA